MHKATTGTLQTPGAKLFYKMQGEGPALLVLQGGAADADGSDSLAARLAGEFSVISFDRRGLSRSALEAPAAGLSLEVHSGDALQLLDALSPAPAFVFGASIGALIGLDLLARRPDRVRRLVAHEPPISQLLDEPERGQLVSVQEEVEAIHRREGVRAAMARFMASLGVNPLDREPGLEPPRPGPHVGRNLEFFLTNDAPAVRQYRLNIAALKPASSQIVPAVGQTSRTTLHAASALALARMLGVEVAELPGGHGGYASHPQAFAAKLRELLLR